MKLHIWCLIGLEFTVEESVGNEIIYRLNYECKQGSLESVLLCSVQFSQLIKLFIGIIHEL